jgi:hypothetical protein
MTYNEVVESFLKKIKTIANSKPAYKQPGDGSDGTCDCIGLIIGAIRRMGLKWTGIHGSNWAARKEIVELKKISNANDLQLGDIVFKAYEPGDPRNKLPARYKKGGQYYNGDLKDYYHVGVVTQVNPLRITHMTSPTVKVDTNLGKWSYYGISKILNNVAPEPEPTPVPSTGSIAVVVADNGFPVKMRQYPSTSCATWVKLPVGTRVEIISPGEQWAQINAFSRKGWYMMAKFLDVVGDGKGKY